MAETPAQLSPIAALAREAIEVHDGPGEGACECVACDLAVEVLRLTERLAAVEALIIAQQKRHVAEEVDGTTCEVMDCNDCVNGDGHTIVACGTCHDWDGGHFSWPCAERRTADTALAALQGTS